MDNENSASTNDDRAAAFLPPGIRVIESAELMKTDKTVAIRHGDELYRLTITRNGKLLLQK